MDETKLKYATERARNLSRELMLRDENLIAKSDVELCAESFTDYGSAFLAKKLGWELGDLERRIVGYYAEEMANSMQGRDEYLLGPTDSELCSRALKLYGRNLKAKLRSALAEAA